MRLDWKGVARLAGIESREKPESTLGRTPQGVSENHSELASTSRELVLLTNNDRRVKRWQWAGSLERDAGNGQESRIYTGMPDQRSRITPLYSAERLMLSHTCAWRSGCSAADVTGVGVGS